MNKICFIHIPKTGGGSIKYWFNNIAYDKLVENNIYYKGTMHQSLNEIFLDTKETYDFTFTCVRNIYDKMISFYNWQGSKNKKKFSKGALQYKPSIDAHNKGIVEFMYYHKDINHMMVRSQVEFVQDVDYVMKLENINEDFKKIQKITGCFEPLQKTKHIRNYDSKIFFTKDFKEAIQDLFKDELDYFNWKPRY